MRARIGTLASTALKHPGKDIKASTWSAWATDLGGDAKLLSIWHHATCMMSAEVNGDIEVEHLSTGWGSVSDQNGMNQIMRDLGLRLKMRRDWRGGGPRFEEF